MGFKSGDVLTCIDNGRYPELLTIGQDYVVLRLTYRGKLIEIQGDSGALIRVYPYRFKYSKQYYLKRYAETR